MKTFPNNLRWAGCLPPEGRRCDGGSSFQRAFTLLELAVLLLVIGLLAMVATPVFCRTRPDSRSVQCLSNTRALIVAWQMYAQDNGDRMVIALHGGASAGGAGDPALGAGWVSGWLDWGGRSDNTNVLFLTQERYAKLAKYVTRPSTYKCPSDVSVSSLQIGRGWTQRCRSYSGNIYIGEGNAEEGPTDPLYRHVKKTSDFRYPDPASTWVFVDEHPDSINDPAFWSPHQSNWIDVPAPFHNGATPFAFADGHSEMHRWEASLTRNRATQLWYSEADIGVNVPPGDADLHWFSSHSSRVSSASY
jgi:prepilin-type processing-associated H-X9-DG protein